MFGPATYYWVGMVRIDSTSFGEVSVDGKTYYSDMTVWWDGKVEYRTKSHEVGVEEMAMLLKRKPEAIVLGTGQHGVVKLLPKAEELAYQAGVEIFQETSPKAIEIFNGLVAQGKKAVAVIHTTC